MTERRLRLWDDERGATALLIAAGMVLFLGMAALAVDYGLGVNERRQDQTAADSGVMAGAVESLNGGLAVRDQTLQFVRSNLPTTYSNGEWQALWESCVDPAAERNAGGFNFVALQPPPGWTVTDPANWCISAEGARGLLRVRVPDQIIDTAFGPILGIDQLTTRATAVSRIQYVGEGGVLPFGIPAGSGAGGLACPSSAPSGLAIDPCSGPKTGNFGTLKARKFGNPLMGTSANCNASPLNQVLAQNIAHGVDHIVVPDGDGAIANEVRDECFNPFVDTMNTDTGFPNNATEDGLLGPVVGGFTPRFAQYGPNNITLFGRTADNTPLWQWLLDRGVSYGGDPSTDAGPASCERDSISSWMHMKVCLDEYVDGGYSGQIFDNIGENRARFGYVPEFWESSLGSGNSWRHIRRFRAVYLQTTVWKKGQGEDFLFHHPGEGDPVQGWCQEDDGALQPCSGSQYRMIQLSMFIIPDSALPEHLRGDPPPGASGINPFEVELFG